MTVTHGSSYSSDSERFDSILAVRILVSIIKRRGKITYRRDYSSPDSSGLSKRGIRPRLQATDSV